MGGRGSAGSAGGMGRVAEFSAPRMSGSEKQVAWATDILREPYTALGGQAKSHERTAKELGNHGGRELEQARAYRNAQNRYAEQVKQLGELNLTAGQVIDRKNRFMGIARAIAEDEFKRRGFKPYEVSLPR